MDWPLASKRQPVVGVIIPCFNQGIYVAEAVASVLRQTYAHTHAVVINDASTDHHSAALCDAAACSRVEIVHLSRNHGRALVRNVGLSALAKSDYVLMLDCDDVLESNYVAQLVTALENNPNAGIAYGVLQFVTHALSPIDRTWPNAPLDTSTMYLENQVPGPGALFRRAALSQTAGWRQQFTKHSGEDFDIWLQVVEAGWSVEWVKDAYYLYRQHSESFLATAGDERQFEVAANILALHLAQIKASVGVREYIERKFLPQITGSLRRGALLRFAKLALRIARIAPLPLVQSVMAYYADRARSALMRGRSGD